VPEKDNRAPKDKLIIIGGLWEKESQAAGRFFNGKLNLPPRFELKDGAKLLIFRNKKPKNENSPPYHLVTPDTRPEGSGEDPEVTQIKRPPGGFEGFGKPEDAAPW